MVDRLPRICFVAPNAFPLLAHDANIEFVGGAELQQVMIAKALTGRGYPVSMICRDFGQADVCEIEGITVYRTSRPNDGVPGLRFIWPKLTSMWRALKRADADIYYQRTASRLTGVMATFCRRYGKKSIFAMAGEAKIRFGHDRWLYRYGVRRVDRVVVQNLAQARLVSDEFGRDSVVIPSMYQDAAPVKTTSRQSILWVGMIRQVKRPDIFLDIVDALPGLPFVMVGGRSAGEAQLYEAVRDRAAKLQNLDFAGFVPYREIDPYFDNALLFVNTSDSEGFPNTFLQSWSRGVPTVSFVDSGAAVNGEPVGVRVSCVREMREAISGLAGNINQCTKLGQEARRYVELNHAPQRVLDLYGELFRGMMEENAPG